MIKAIVSDLSRTCLFMKKDISGQTLNSLYAELTSKSDKFDFWEYFYLDTDYMQFLKSFEKQFQLYMFTSGKIQNDPNLKPKLDEVFKHIFDSEEIGPKDNSNSYAKLAEKLNLAVSEILFIDDDERFIEAATASGIRTNLYTGLNNLISSLETILNPENSIL